MDRVETTIFHAIIGFILGLGGTIGAMVWYSQTNNRGVDEEISAMAGIGPLILGIFAFLILVWSVMALIFFVVAAKKNKKIDEI